MYKGLIERLRQYSQNIVAYKLGADFADAVCSAADALENQQREIDALMQIIDKQAGLNQTLADIALELDQAKAERDEYFEQLRGLCFCCGHKTDGFDCHAKCYGHRRGTAWIYGGPQKEE